MVQWEVICSIEEQGSRRASAVRAQLGTITVEVFEAGDKDGGRGWWLRCQPLNISYAKLDAQEVEAAKLQALLHLGSVVRPLLAPLFPLEWRHQSAQRLGLFLGPIEVAVVRKFLDAQVAWDFAGVTLPRYAAPSEAAAQEAAKSAVYAVLAGTYAPEARS